MKNIITILPISRIKYLDRVLTSLESQTVKIDKLLVIYEGPSEGLKYIEGRVSHFEDATCVLSPNTGVGLNIHDRRRNISNIHNFARQFVGEADCVFSVEDDGILPPDALERLVSVFEAEDRVGMVSGVELGRWGRPYVGIWGVNDYEKPTSIYTLPRAEGVGPIDAAGLYCALIRASLYKDHEFFYDNGLGPDVNLGIYLRRRGYYNFVDWEVNVTHLTQHWGFEVEIPATDRFVPTTLTRQEDGSWEVKRLT